MLFFNIMNIFEVNLQTSIFMISDFPIYIFSSFTFEKLSKLKTEKSPDWVNTNNFWDEVLKLQEFTKSLSNAERRSR